MYIGIGVSRMKSCVSGIIAVARLRAEGRRIVGSRWILICFRQSSRSSSRSPLAHHPVTSSATEVDIRSPRFDVGYIIRRSEYAPGFEREEREGRRAGRCARGGYSNGPTLVWKCARCKDDGGIRREPRRGDITSR